MDASSMYHTSEWSMYHNYQDDAATPFTSSWFLDTPQTLMPDNSTLQQQYQHLPQEQQPSSSSSQQYYQQAPQPRTVIPFYHFSDSPYPHHQAPPTPLLEFSPSPTNGNTPDWAFPSLDDSRGAAAPYYDGGALCRSAAVVAPLPMETYADHRHVVDILSSPSDGGDEFFLGGGGYSKVPLEGISRSYPSPVSSPLRHTLEQRISSPISPISPLSPPARKWTPEEEDFGGDDDSDEYKPTPSRTTTATRRPTRSSPTTSTRSRLSTTSHGCRPQTTLDTSCLLSTKMVRAPAKDDADDMFKPFICHYGHDGPSGPCNKGFHKKNEWKRHLRTIHAWDEALQIQRGELSFAEARLVTDDDGLAEMVAEITRCFCSGCGKLFARPEILTRHWNNVEKAEKRKALKAAREQAAARTKIRASSSKRGSR